MASESPFSSATALCQNRKDLSESKLVSKLKAILKKSPDVIHRADAVDETLLHHAAEHRSPEFCKLLIDVNPDLVKNADNRYGRLPFHNACFGVNTETAKYLYNIYPKSINIPDGRGNYPLHMLMISFTCFNIGGRIEERNVELTQFLLQYDQGAVSKPSSSGYLPLHYVCRWMDLDVIKLIFNAYPEAIHMRTNDSRRYTPLDFASPDNMFRQDNLIEFLEHQIDLERQAREERETDEHGQLPIHEALLDRETEVGAIKLMVAAYPASVGMTDIQRHTLLHFACQGGNLDTVKYIMGISQDFLNLPDLDGNLPLHVACMRGNCDLISHIIEQSTFGVMLQNSAKQTPIELLLFESECDRTSMEYVEAVRCLFQVNPVDTLKCLTGKNKQCADGRRKRKRKRRRA